MTVVAVAATGEAFPKFFDYNSDGAPNIDLAEVSDDDSETRAKYVTKEDQDVAVFMAIADKLPIRSLVHLLQGHASSQVGSQYCAFTTELHKKTQAEKEHHAKTKKIKKFRFAEVAGGQVRCVVHRIDCVKDFKEMWWSDEDMMGIRREAILDVKYFRKHRTDYTLSVETVIHDVNKESVEKAMKALTHDSFARGLEAHIVNMLSQSRSELVGAVLEEQKECQMCQDSYELTSESLRGQSLAYSRANVAFSRKMAECDQIEALKAVLAKWEPEVKGEC